MTRARVAVVALLGCAAACSPPERTPRWREAGATTPRRGGTLRVATADQATTLDPAHAYDEASIYACVALFERLVDYAPDSTTLVPRLAERWDISPDGRTYRFWLRPGITYADGRPIVAADVAASLARVLTDPASPFGAQLVDVEGAAALTAGAATTLAGVTTPSDRELVIRLARPNAAFLAILAMPFAAPLPAAYVAEVGAELRRRPLASGPFVLERWDEGVELVLARNPRYHAADRVHLDRVVNLERRDPAAELLMFEAGELDASNLPAADYVWFATQPAWAPYLERRPVMFTVGSRFNVRVPPFDDRRVRQAFNYALNKRHMLALIQGRGEPAHGILPPAVLGHDPTLAPYPHDPARARALLAEAGHAAGLAVTYAYPPIEPFDRLALSLQADLAAVGVTVTLAPTDLGTLVPAIMRPDGPPLSWTSWFGDHADPVAFLDTRFHARAIAPEASVNDTFYANPALDALLDRARAETSPAARAALYHQAERVLFDDAPWIWGYYHVGTRVRQPYVQGFGMHPVWNRVYADAWLDLGADGRPRPWGAP